MFRQSRVASHNPLALPGPRVPRTKTPDANPAVSSCSAAVEPFQSDPSAPHAFRRTAVNPRLQSQLRARFLRAPLLSVHLNPAILRELHTKPSPAGLQK